MDFVAGIPGNEFKLIGKGLSGQIIQAGANGLMVLAEIQRDTVFRYPMGSRIHELTNPQGDVFVLFGYEVDSMDFTSPDFEQADALAGYPSPAGWTYSTRILENDLVMGASGTVTVLSINSPIASSTWEKR